MRSRLGEAGHGPLGGVVQNRKRQGRRSVRRRHEYSGTVKRVAPGASWMIPPWYVYDTKKGGALILIVPGHTFDGAMAASSLLQQKFLLRRNLVVCCRVFQR